MPNCKEPKNITEYRPISLCNVVYKIASKVIANRLKKILPTIISDTQSAFVHRRLLTDNVLVTFEAMHLDFLNSGISPPKFNETHTMLMPNFKEPKNITGYRPISLCNVVYKIASKAIANRLKKILPTIISDTQSAFVHRRLITDNVLVTFEAMHLDFLNSGISPPKFNETHTEIGRAHV